jgi:hypothetical protein
VGPAAKAIEYDINRAPSNTRKNIRYRIDIPFKYMSFPEINYYTLMTISIANICGCQIKTSQTKTFTSSASIFIMESSVKFAILSLELIL